MKDPIESISYALAVKAKEWYPDLNRDVSDIRYGLALNLNFYGVIVVTLAIGLLTHAFPETALTMAGIWVLRRLTGGRHMPTLTLCFLFSVAVMAAIPHIHLSAYWTDWVNTAALLLTAMFTEYRRRLPIAAAIIAVNFVLASDILALAFLSQVSTCIHVNSSRR